MKAKRILFRLLAVLVITAMLVWIYWPAKNPAPGPTVSAAPKPAAPPVVVSKPVVEAPRLPPTPTSTSSASPTVADNGSSLYDASKARAAAPNSAGTGDDDYNAIVKGSPGLAKLDNILAQNAAVVQSVTPVNPSTIPPMVITELGEISLTKGTPELRKLASGDEAMFTLISSPTVASGNGGRFLIQVSFLHPNTDGSFDTILKTAAMAIVPGQPAVIKSVPTGNEIHFVLELTTPAGTAQ